MNPAHLFLGTHADNMRDMIEKRRHSFGDKHATKLTSEAVADIRRAVMTRSATQGQLAERYGVSRSLIGLVATYKRWRWTEGDEDARADLANKPPRSEWEFCLKGHRYDDVGYYAAKNGSRLCKECHRLRMDRYYAKNGGRKRRLPAP